MRRSRAATQPKTACLPAHVPVAPVRRRRRRAEPVPIVRKPRHRRSERGERMLTVAALFTGGLREFLPMIRIRGAWLGKLGFTIGRRIVVSEERGRIVLTLEASE